MKTKALTKIDRARIAKKFEERSGRSIVVDGVNWKWNAGTEFITAHCEDGTSIKKASINGYQYEAMPVTPSQVATWIRENSTITK